MSSIRELRRIIEVAFLPTKCLCTVDQGKTLIIQLIDAETQQEQLTVTGIDPQGLRSIRAIALLVAEIKEELRLNAAGIDQPRKRLRR
ncbi:DUF1652 domain-containing protein [Pseudomonas asplenii]|uniref:DUF1652 domain-containing protein n=1 Tax=Pseudomonas asplenii TaxID=53407 RepID=UPI00049545D7|nr:DUF1652 domain-containing protein [Pseudomonas asplenii]UZE27201.1 DUF1652 domain-containing protein [Pseudomonas asplenii]